MENCVFKSGGKSQEELQKAWKEFKPAEDEIKVEYLDNGEFIKTSFRMSDNIINCANRWADLLPHLPELPSGFEPNTIKVIDTPSSFDIMNITSSCCE